jgi:hypothetical protein
MSVRAAPLPTSVAMLAAGSNSQVTGALALPLDLTPQGLTGCLLRVSPDFVVLMAGSGGAATFTMSVPNMPALVGVRFHQQALVFDPLAGNPASAVMSDAATAVIGP